MFDFLTRKQLMLLGAIVAGSAIAGYIVPTEAAKLIATNQIADGAITTPKIANGAVTLAKFGTGVADSLKGSNGIDGTNGINCWDLNGDGVQDASEDINSDGQWDALDCQGSSTGFHPNTAPIVDAGPDQSVEGVLFQTGGGCAPIIGCTPTTYHLGCQFDLTGDVQDDEFTGFLSTKWSSLLPVQFSSEDSLNAQVALQASSPDPFTSDLLPFTVTLAANDGILEGSDDVSLTCTLPAG